MKSGNPKSLLCLRFIGFKSVANCAFVCEDFVPEEEDEPSRGVSLRLMIEADGIIKISDPIVFPGLNRFTRNIKKAEAELLAAANGRIGFSENQESSLIPLVIDTIDVEYEMRGMNQW